MILEIKVCKIVMNENKIHSSCIENISEFLLSVKFELIHLIGWIFLICLRSNKLTLLSGPLPQCRFYESLVVRERILLEMSGIKHVC